MGDHGHERALRGSPARSLARRLPSGAAIARRRSSGWRHRRPSTAPCRARARSSAIAERRAAPGIHRGIGARSRPSGSLMTDDASAARPGAASSLRAPARRFSRGSRRACLQRLGSMPFAHRRASAGAAASARLRRRGSPLTDRTTAGARSLALCGALHRAHQIADRAPAAAALRGGRSGGRQGGRSRRLLACGAAAGARSRRRPRVRARPCCRRRGARRSARDRFCRRGRRRRRRRGGRRLRLGGRRRRRRGGRGRRGLYRQREPACCRRPSSGRRRLPIAMPAIAMPAPMIKGARFLEGPRRRSAARPTALAPWSRSAR